MTAKDTKKTVKIESPDSSGNTLNTVRIKL